MGETYSQQPVEESAEPPWCVAAEGNSLPTTSTNTVTTFEKSFTSKDPNSPGHPPHGLVNATATSWRDEYRFSHTLTANEVAQRLDVDPEYGLSTTEAESRLRRDGLNKVEDAKGLSLWKILLRQASNSLTLVLVITMALSYGIHDYIEGGVITAVILLNIVVGFVQDYHAEKQIMSLYALSAPMSKVIRDGQLVTIKAEQLVVGDIVKLAVGDIVPADLRLIEGINAATDEALLTGESLPVTKTPDAVFANRNMPVGDRTNLAYSASTMSAGRATGIVISTGMDTEVGNIAGLLRKQEVEEFHSNPVIRLLQRAQRSMKVILGLVGTPLQVKLSKFALLLFALAILLAIIVFSASKWDIQGEVLIYGICVAVAVIPESLIAVLTVTMAIGTKAMAGGNVIVRKLQALEAVGGVTAICSDKTGTLTQGKMIARKAWIPDFGNISIHETTRPFDPTNGNIHMNDKEVDLGAIKSLQSMSQFLDAIALCNLSSVFKTNTSDSTSEEWSAVGEPTEIALQVFAMRFNNGKASLLENGDLKQIAEFAFDSSCKRMTVIYKSLATGEVTAYSKGAPEVMLPLLSCSKQEKTEISAMVEKMAGEGLRVLCIGEKAIDSLNNSQPLDRQSVEIDINFLGLIGLYDPPRAETADAVRRCQQAGITVHMLTGDHIRTATAIAYEVGILGPSLTRAQAGSAIMPAEEFDKLTDQEIDAIQTLPLVLARCSPSTKVRMVEAMHRRREYCAMTGDGVNDSPALKRADIGIAMGLNGSDVTKEAADMVLTDDNFASIVKAVEEGRRLFDNIQKFLMHLLISNISQVILLLIGLSFKDANNHSVFPLSPLEILWVNLITSSFLALGLGLEEVQPDIMSRPPHDLHVGVFTRELIVDKFIYGTFMGCLCLVAFVSVTYGAGDGDLGLDCNDGWNESCDIVFRARSTTYATLTFLLLVTAWEVKHFSRSLFNFDPSRYSGPFSIFPTVWRNRFLFWAVVAGFVIAFPVVYLPFVNKEVFKHSAITWEWGIVIGCLVTYVALVESWKAIKRRFGIASRKHERQQQV